MAEHARELARAKDALSLKLTPDLVVARSELPKASGRWRWIVTKSEAKTMFTEEPIQAVEPVSLSVSPLSVGSHNWDARFKTFSYLTHAQAAHQAATD